MPISKAIIIGVVVAIAVVIAIAAYFLTLPSAVTSTPTPTSTPMSTPAPSQPQVNIKLCLLFPLTGAHAMLGTDQMTGARIAIEMVNDKGGVLGKYKVDVVIADSKSDPKVAASEAERLITVEGCKIIIGSFASPLLLSASEVAERYRVIYWEVGAITDSATLRGFKYLFRPQAIGGDFGYVSVLFIRDVVSKVLGKPLNEIRVAIIHEDGPYGTSVAKANEELCRKLGIPVVLKEAYPSTATDLSPLILKLKAANPDVILATSYYGDTVLFLKQAKELGLKFKVFIGHGAGHGLPATWEALGKDLNYIFNVDPPSPYMNLDVLDPNVRKDLEEFVNRFRAERGHDPLTHALMGFAGTWILLNHVLPLAITKYGSVDPEAVRKAALELDIPDGGTPWGFGVKFSSPEYPEDTIIGKEFGRNAPHIGQNIRARPVVMQWYEGKLYVVWPEQFAVRKPVIPLPPESPYAATS